MIFNNFGKFIAPKRLWLEGGDMQATKHLNLSELLLIHSGVLDAAGKALHQREDFSKPADRLRIEQHIKLCADCAGKARRAARAEGDSQMAPPRQNSTVVQYLRRLPISASVGVAALLLLGIVFSSVAPKRAGGMLHKSDFREAQVALQKDGREIGSATMAPYSVMKISERGIGQQRVQISEGAAEITLDATREGRLELQGDHGRVKVSWPASELDKPVEPIRFWVFDRDERTGAPDFYVKVTSGKLLVVEDAARAKSEFAAGEMFMVYKNNLVATVAR